MAGDVRWSSSVSAMVATNRPDRSRVAAGTANRRLFFERLVERGVRRHPCHQRELAALALEHAPPEAVGVAGEDVARERRLGEPGLLGELVVELSLAPPGIPGEDPHAG